MDFLDKLERKFGKFSIPRLMMYICGGQALLFCLQFVVGGFGQMCNLFCFDIDRILHGQIWRIFTFVFIPNSNSIFFLLFSILLYYSIGNALEYTWGTFKFNVYYFTGVIFNVVAISVYAYLMGVNETIRYGIFLSYSIKITYYLNLSLFLAYATLYPDQEFSLYGIIPIKVKYLALLDIALLLFDFLQQGTAGKVLLIVSLANYFLFFWAPLFKRKQTKTQKQFRRNMNKGVKKPGEVTRIAFHKCYVCGKTELTDPDMDFRYSTDSNGETHEYCMDHLPRK